MSTTLPALKKREQRHSAGMHRYSILKVLGDGTYGDVSLGLNKETGEKVAIKRCDFTAGRRGIRCATNAVGSGKQTLWQMLRHTNPDWTRVTYSTVEMIVFDVASA